jgi:hypothetical protein
MQAFPGAADGIRTHDLLHGKQLPLALQGGVFALWERLWGESSGEGGPGFAAVCREFPDSIRTESGLAAASSGGPYPVGDSGSPYPSAPHRVP